MQNTGDYIVYSYMCSYMFFWHVDCSISFVCSLTKIIVR